MMNYAAALVSNPKAASLSKRVMRSLFRAAFMRSIRSYHIHERTSRVDASVRQPHDIGAASSGNPYLPPEGST